MAPSRSLLPLLLALASCAPRGEPGPQDPAPGSGTPLEAFDGEGFGQRAAQQLSALADLALHGAADSAALEALALETIRGDLLRPALHEVHASPALVVRRPAPSNEAGSQGFEGLEALADSVGAWIAPLGAAADVHFKFKVVRSEAGDDADSARTRVLVQTYGAARVQQRSTWDCVWRGIEAPLLAQVRVSGFEETERTQARPWFADATEAVFGALECFENELAPGLNRWRGELDRRLGIDLFGHHGLALADVDGDGRCDVFLCQNGGLSNRLFLQQEDGTARDVTREAGLEHLDRSSAALFVDLDEDGDLDLALTTDALLLFERLDAAPGSRVPRFSLRASYPDGRNLTSMCAADADLDGDLDLYLCGYQSPEAGAPDPYHDANNGPPNTLYRNEGGFRLTDVTAACGLDQNNRRFSFAAAWEDYDEDGDVDLYVANDFGRNNLYRNDSQGGGLAFVDVAAEAGVEDLSAGMSVAFGDADGDGRSDLYVSNMFSSAGNRVTYARSFQEREDETTRAGFQRHARGNSLFLNQGDGRFRDASEELDVSMGRWAWGSGFCDLDLDGREDLVVANGFLTNEDPADL